MEVFEVINNILDEKNMTKRDFAQKLIALEPKSNRTGEIISENIVYSYLSGQTTIKTYLIPYISDVLGVPEQFLFDNNVKVRKKLLKYLAESLTEDEYAFLSNNLKPNLMPTSKVSSLLKYAPSPLLKKLETSLEKIKNITDEF